VSASWHVSAPSVRVALLHRRVRLLPVCVDFHRFFIILTVIWAGATQSLPPF
jgi:hypothetical protein